MHLSLLSVYEWLGCMWISWYLMQSYDDTWWHFYHWCLCVYHACRSVNWLCGLLILWKLCDYWMYVLIMILVFDYRAFINFSEGEQCRISCLQVLCDATIFPSRCAWLVVYVHAWLCALLQVAGTRHRLHLNHQVWACLNLMEIVEMEIALGPLYWAIIFDEDVYPLSP